MEKKIRTNIFLSQDLKKYVEKEASSLGMTNSAFMVMCINQYKEKKELNSFSRSSIDDFMKKIESIK